MLEFDEITQAGAADFGENLVLEIKGTKGEIFALRIPRSKATVLLHGVLVAMQQSSINLPRAPGESDHARMLQSLLPIQQLDAAHVLDGSIALRLVAHGAPLDFLASKEVQAKLRAHLEDRQQSHDSSGTGGHQLQ